MAETKPRGRPKGSLNKVTLDVKMAAQQYTDKALKTLARIMENGESETAQVAAANSILDRAYGKPKQALDVDAKTTISVVERQIVRPQHPDG